MTTRQTPDAVREAVYCLCCCRLEADHVRGQCPETSYFIPNVPAALDSRAGDAGEGIENGYTADDAVDFVFNRLASKLGLAEWQVVEGSEEWEGDVAATLHRLLIDAGIIDDETGAVATLATPTPAINSASDAGEAKAYRCRGCGWRGSDPIAVGHPQNGCDLELMVHDPIATPAPAVDAKARTDMAAALRNTPAEALREAGYLERAAKMIEAPAVDAVPAGEVERAKRCGWCIDFPHSEKCDCPHRTGGRP